MKKFSIQLRNLGLKLFPLLLSWPALAFGSDQITAPYQKISSVFDQTALAPSIQIKKCPKIGMEITITDHIVDRRIQPAISNSHLRKPRPPEIIETHQINIERRVTDQEKFTNHIQRIGFIAGAATGACILAAALLSGGPILVMLFFGGVSAYLTAVAGGQIGKALTFFRPASLLFQQQRQKRSK